VEIQASGELPVTLETVLWWQETIASIGDDYISPLISSFSRADASPLAGQGLAHIECSVVFLPASEGGRTSPFPSGALSGDTYRPHLVIGDPAQRRPVVADGNRLIGEYISVAFHHGPAVPQIGVEMTTVLTLMYFPHPMYDKLAPGVTFTVREGAQIVGYGWVNRWLD
jgi:hypothetical protein